MATARWIYCLGALFVVATLVGCGSGQTETARQQESSHLRALIGLHRYATTQLGHRPTSEGEFKEFISNRAQAMLETLKVQNVDELFISERDNEPFVVMYGQQPPGVAPDVVAFERTGVDGKRLVGFGLGMIQEVGEEKFSELVPEGAVP